MATPPVVFPLTYDPVAQAPTYAAKDLRLTMSTACAVPDGSPFGGVQGVRAGSPSPLSRISGTTVTVSAHMGWLSPWPGNGTYSYALQEPMSTTVDSSTGSYKIAVILEDKASGHGAGEQVYVKSYSAYTADSQIPGLVVARVDSGVVSDVAPVILQETMIKVRTRSQLDGLTVADGVSALLADGTRYVCSSGAWVLDPSILQLGKVTIKDPKLKVDRLEKINGVVHLTAAINEPNAPKAGYIYGTIPAGFRPAVNVHITEGDGSGVNGAVRSDGSLWYQSSTAFNRWIDRTWIAA